MSGADLILDSKTLSVQDPREAFQEFLDKETAPMLRLARHLLRDEEEARDLVQDALLKAYLSLDSFRWECSLKGWVRRIVVNQGLKKIRRRKLHERVTSYLRPGSQPALGPAARATPEDQAGLRQEVDLLERALRTLSPRQRAVLILRYQEGLSVAEVAEAMDIGVGTVKTHLVRAVRQVRSLKEKAATEVDDD